ncbi:MAG: thioredoxin-dependent thiol peroxidase [Kiritimatiellaeota bacterium]|nr:thioredoxin-dependent thiol peroxidase [Kiritimatiellota bacterium]
MTVPKLQKGDLAPDFALPDQNGNTVRLEDLRGKKVLLYFYPRAMTPGCTTQSCAVRDALPDLAARETAALGISPDPPDRQKRFDEKHGLGFPLLSDPDFKTAEAYGAFGQKKLYGKTFLGITRSAFLIDEAGRIAGVWYKVSPKKTVPEVLKVLEAQAGE